MKLLIVVVASLPITKAQAEYIAFMLTLRQRKRHAVAPSTP
jgi:hypothetical protein